MAHRNRWFTYWKWWFSIANCNKLPEGISFILGYSMLTQEFWVLDDYCDISSSFIIYAADEIHKSWQIPIQWEFQDPKLEVLYQIRPYFVGIFPYTGLKHRPYIWSVPPMNQWLLLKTRDLLWHSLRSGPDAEDKKPQGYCPQKSYGL